MENTRNTFPACCGLLNSLPVFVLALLMVTSHVSPTLTTCPTAKCCVVGAGVLLEVELVPEVDTVPTAVPVLAFFMVELMRTDTPIQLRTSTAAIIPRISGSLPLFFLGSGCCCGYCEYSGDCWGC